MAPLTRYKGQYLKAKMKKWNQIDEAKLAARVEDMVDSSIAKKVLQWVLTLGASLTSPWID